MFVSHKLFYTHNVYKFVHITLKLSKLQLFIIVIIIRMQRLTWHKQNSF